MTYLYLVRIFYSGINLLITNGAFAYLWMLHVSALNAKLNVELFKDMLCVKQQWRKMPYEKRCLADKTGTQRKHRGSLIVW